MVPAATTEPGEAPQRPDTLSPDMHEYKKSFEVRWADLDPNRHLRNTAYNDYATHVRFRYLEERGFGAAEFAAHDIGPVIFREEVRYYREITMNETITVDYKVAGLTPDARRFRLTHDILRGDGVLAARLVAEGAWLDLTKRKVVTPPPQLAELLRALPRTADFEELVEGGRAVEPRTRHHPHGE